MELARYLLNLEKNLLLGSARWVADFTESFRDYPIEDVTFDMVVTGKMRVKGFLLSRIVSYLLMPNYYAACLVYAGELDAQRVKTLCALALRYAEREQLRWVWLVLPGEGPFPRKIRSAVTGQTQSDALGVALVDLGSQEVISNDSYLGRRMHKHIECFR